MTYTFDVPHAPVPKGRPRMTRRGRVYTPQRTHEAEMLIATLYHGPKFEGPVAVAIDYYKDHQVITIEEAVSTNTLRSDIDNLGKLSLDALQLGGAFDNDKCVAELWLAKL